MRSHALKVVACAVGIALTMAVSGSARAASIEYIFTGTADGSLGGTSFSGASLRLIFSLTRPTVTSGGGEFFNTASSAAFTVGASTGSLLGVSNSVASNPAFLGGTVIFGQTQSALPFFVGEGLSGLGSYDLTTAFALTSGPVSQTINSLFFHLLRGSEFRKYLFAQFSSRASVGYTTPTDLDDDADGPRRSWVYALSEGEAGQRGRHDRRLTSLVDPERTTDRRQAVFLLGPGFLWPVPRLRPALAPAPRAAPPTPPTAVSGGRPQANY